MMRGRDRESEKSPSIPNKKRKTYLLAEKSPSIPNKKRKTYLLARGFRRRSMSSSRFIGKKQDTQGTLIVVVIIDIGMRSGFIIAASVTVDLETPGLMKLKRR